MRIKKVIPESGFVLRIFSEDGRQGLFDVSRFLDGEAFQPLRARSEFEKVKAGGYYIEWDCGADLCAATIETYWELA